MAEALVGGAFLSASLQVLFDRMASQHVMDFIRGKKLKKGLFKKLEVAMLSVNAVLKTLKRSKLPIQHVENVEKKNEQEVKN
ncbi:Uncharacterized protein TCM_036372 [Theobroma cacao]|uniref:Uncharacterized protein n=1 Tax=Theobroma cacao TaxID=3641 RepID=A0A061FRU4_THECC|nr:Uncharacterized protein TCM_036372 [Theobroma cacao]